MPLTVLSIAYPFAQVRPDTAGGSEQILLALDRALVRAGHRSLVVAQAGSRIAGTLLPTPVEPGQITEAQRVRVRRWHQANIDRVLATETVDLVHMHGIDFHEYAVRANVPVLVTLHLPPSWYPPSIWARPPQPGQATMHLQCVSTTQRASCPAGFRDLPVVANGVCLPQRRLPRRARGFALALGRLCPEKNLHTALDAGTRAGIPVLIGGQVYPYPDHQRYFAEEIAPRLAAPANTVGHRFLGLLGPARKRRLLRGAQCLLLPTLAPETSSLVAMEACAEGTPVVAFPSGAVPEIVRDGVTGFLVRDVDEMARAIGRAAEINPEICRQHARECFSEQRMIADYFALYDALLAGKPPQVIETASTGAFAHA